jgi:hypothetical protein
MTEDAAPETDSAVPAKHKIVAGAALIAVLAGAGISALDTPWWNGSDGRLARKDAIKLPTPAPKPVRAAQPASVAVAATPTVPAAARPAVEARPKLRRTKRETRPAPTTAEAPAAATTTSIAGSGATIDAQYEATTAFQCAKGLSGFFCREQIRWRLCKGRWSDGVQPGASRCHVEKAETAVR